MHFPQIVFPNQVFEGFADANNVLAWSAACLQLI